MVISKIVKRIKVHKDVYEKYTKYLLLNHSLIQNLLLLQNILELSYVIFKHAIQIVRISRNACRCGTCFVHCFPVFVH